VILSGIFHISLKGLQLITLMIKKYCIYFLSKVSVCILRSITAHNFQNIIVTYKVGMGFDPYLLCGFV